MNGKITVTRISEVTQFDHLARPTPMIQVQFTVGDNGPFTELFPKAGYDPAAVRQKLDAFANSLQIVTGY